jgi:hypothetical protein
VEEMAVVQAEMRDILKSQLEVLKGLGGVGGGGGRGKKRRREDDDGEEEGEVVAPYGPTD